MAEITLAARIAEIEPLTEFVNGQLEAMDCPMKAQIQIDVAIDEIFGNIANYAYGDGEGEATVQVEPEPTGGVRLTFIDRGVPYDPLAKEDPDVTLSAERREIGGLGIFMVKKTMDELSYRRQGEENVFSVVKRF